MAYTLTFTTGSLSPEVNGVSATNGMKLHNGDTIVVRHEYYWLNVNGKNYGDGDETITITDSNINLSTGNYSSDFDSATLTIKFVDTSVVPLSVDLTSLSGYESLSAGTYQLGVKAQAQGYQDSDLSQTVSFTKLAAPVVTASNTTVTWDGITNAESYDIYVDGELYENTTGSAGFTQIPVTRTSDNYSQISDLDTNKIYTVNMSLYGGIQSFKFTNGWQRTDDQNPVYLERSTNTSIVFYWGSTGTGSDYFESWGNVIALEGDAIANESDFANLTPQNNGAYWPCIIEGTQITLADRTTKPIEDITYNDDLLVWNFYKGKFDSAKPCWIIKPQVATEYNLCKFSNGAEVGFVGQGGNIGYHRIYNNEAKAFTHTGVAETPVGTHTFAEDESFPELVSQEIIKKPVRFYNVGTTKHINLFANGILTSSRISNKYAIKDMKYVDEQLISDDEERAYIEEKLTHC